MPRFYRRVLCLLPLLAYTSALAQSPPASLLSTEPRTSMDVFTALKTYNEYIGSANACIRMKNAKARRLAFAPIITAAGVGGFVYLLGEGQKADEASEDDNGGLLYYPAAGLSLGLSLSELFWSWAKLDEISTMEACVERNLALARQVFPHLPPRR